MCSSAVVSVFEWVLKTHLATSAALFKSIVMSNSWPCLAAEWRGVLPYLSTHSTSAPAREKNKMIIIIVITRLPMPLTLQHNLCQTNCRLVTMWRHPYQKAWWRLSVAVFSSTNLKTLWNQWQSQRGATPKYISFYLLLKEAFILTCSDGVAHC